jgi:hypothetical protein
MTEFVGGADKRTSTSFGFVTVRRLLQRSIKAASVRP